MEVTFTLPPVQQGAGVRARRQDGTGAPRDQEIAALLLVLLVGLLVVPLGRILWHQAGHADDFNQRVSVSPFDVPLALLLALFVIRCGHPRTWPRPRGAALAATALAVVLAVAFAVHPSIRGVDLALRVAAGAAVVASMRALPRGEARSLVLGAIVVVGAAEAALAMAQSANGGPLGVRTFEFDGPLYPFGSSFAGRGGFDHPYHLTCFLLVAIAAGLVALRDGGPRRPLALGIALCAAGIAVTYSRASLLALVPIVVVCAVVGRRRAAFAITAAAIVIGFALGATLFGDGWVAKSSDSLAADTAGTGRSERAKEALRLVREEPVVGVGPGRYVIALHDVEHQLLLPAHNVVLQEAAEGGVLAGALTLVALVALGLRALRRGAAALCCFLTLVPFFVFDSYPYVFATGLVVAALWVGLIELAGDSR